MRTQHLLTSALALLLSGTAAAQLPPGITMDMVNRQLPLEGAPLAVAGPATAIQEAASGSARHILFRPEMLGANDKLPVVVWGNGGCAMENRRYDGFLSNIASHGYLVLNSVRVEGDAQGARQTPDILKAGIAWAETENARAGSPLQGKIDLSQIAVMGQSCGGFMSVALGGDPRVDTIIVFNSGVSAPVAGQPAGPNATTDALKALHGPVAFINGGEVDFMYGPSRANFDLVNHVPAFYGARENAGHTATMYHPGGGEFANVAVNWLNYHFKGDAAAGKMFVGADCALCTNKTWETAAKGL